MFLGQSLSYLGAGCEEERLLRDQPLTQRRTVKFTELPQLRLGELAGYIAAYACVADAPVR